MISSPRGNAILLSTIASAVDFSRAFRDFAPVAREIADIRYQGGEHSVHADAV